MALQQYYRKHAHKEPNKAIINVAHKLLSRMRAVMNSGIPYQEGLVKQIIKSDQAHCKACTKTDWKTFGVALPEVAKDYSAKLAAVFI